MLSMFPGASECGMLITRTMKHAENKNTLFRGPVINDIVAGAEGPDIGTKFGARGTRERVATDEREPLSYVVEEPVCCL